MEPIPRLAATLSVVVLLTGCASARPHDTTSVGPTQPAVTAPPREPDAVLTGNASWYGRAHQGRKTASGEPFDMNALTAAHRTLPLGTRVLVTNLRNGRTVQVRINDRGPQIPDRIIDLSYAAARALDAVGNGVFRVRIAVMQ